MTAVNCVDRSGRAHSQTAWRLLAFAGSVLVAGGTDVRAQAVADEEGPRPTVSRFDENWSQFCDRNAASSPALKCISVGGARVSLGMDARIRYEIYDPTGFGRGVQDNSGYWLVRAAAHAAVDVSPQWRAFGQVISANVIDRNGGSRPADRNEFDLIQGFVEWRPEGTDNTYVRFGRQEIAFGAGRLLAASEGSNVRRQFDGLRAGVRLGDITYQAVAAGLAQVRPGVFDDSASLDRAVYGIGAVQTTPSGSVNALYVISARRPERLFGAPPAIQDRYTLGGRVVRQSDRWFAEVELIGQAGEAGGLDTRAWAVAGEVARLTNLGDVQMRYALRFSAASGDESPTDGELNGFDPLFPNPTYTGSIPLISPTNTIAFNPRISASWPSRLRVTGDVALIKRLETGDRIYGFSGQAFPVQFNSGDDVGQLWSLSVSRPVNAQWSVATTLSYFEAGDYFRGAPDADTRFLTVNLSYQY